MSMAPSSPSPLQPHTIEQLLAYLIPPSQLAGPLPSHLISRPLLQRHHFLQLSPSGDTEAYLCWPSPLAKANSDAALLDLETLKWTQDASSMTRPWFIRYSYDGEFLFAHAAPSTVTGTARIIFCWSEDQWKYHDLSVMPFPSIATEHPPDTSANGHTATKGEASLPLNGDDDDYWQSYSRQAGEEENDRGGLETSQQSESTDDSEDSYWAQYTAVQGSGDSTQPSPKPNGHFKLLPCTTSHDSPVLIHSTVFRPVFDQTHISVLDPSTTDILDARLRTISMTNGAFQEPDESFLASSRKNSVVDSTTSPDDDTRDDSFYPQVDEGLEYIASRDILASNLPTVRVVQATSAFEPEADSVVRTTVKDVYRLWRLARQGSGTKTDFLQIIKTALEDS